MLDLRWIALASLLLAIPVTATAEFGDPTLPALLPPSASSTEPDPAVPRLLSIWVSGDRRSAVVDGERIEVGGTAAGGRVVAIELSGVRVLRSDGELLLTLTGGGYKTPASPRRKNR